MALAICFLSTLAKKRREKKEKGREKRSGLGSWKKRKAEGGSKGLKDALNDS